MCTLVYILGFICFIVFCLNHKCNNCGFFVAYLFKERWYVSCNRLTGTVSLEFPSFDTEISPLISIGPLGSSKSKADLFWQST